MVNIASNKKSLAEPLGLFEIQIQSQALTTWFMASHGPTFFLSTLFASCALTGRNCQKCAHAFEACGLSQVMQLRPAA